VTKLGGSTTSNLSTVGPSSLRRSITSESKFGVLNVAKRPAFGISILTSCSWSRLTT
jgi:hypothetical protein